MGADCRGNSVPLVGGSVNLLRVGVADRVLRDGVVRGCGRGRGGREEGTGVTLEQSERELLEEKLRVAAARRGQAIEQLAMTAREGKTQLSEMSNGTITLTNIGVFGVDTGTPILNPGEVGIVALGSIRPKPWVVDNEILIRQVTTIGATFDHRVVDGDVASRFVQDVASIIEEPALLLD